MKGRRGRPEDASWAPVLGAERKRHALFQVAVDAEATELFGSPDEMVGSAGKVGCRFYAVQSSTCRFGIRPNSDVLFVTTIKSLALAIAAICKS